MKVALLTDTHFGTRGDSIVFHEYFMKFYNDVFFPELEKRNINTIIHLGDVFDRRKFVNFNILNRVKDELFDEIRIRDIDMHVVVGNHDTYYKNTNEVNSVTLLLGDYDNIKVYPDPCTIELDGKKILMLPWINTDNYDETIDEIKSTEALTVMGHLELSGFLLSPGIVNEHGLSKTLFDKFDNVYTGHFHHKSTDGNITYLGNAYEMTWIDYDDQRGFHIFDTETGEIEFIANPYTMFNKIFYDDLDKTYEDIFDGLDFSKFENRIVKVIVDTKTNPYYFDKYMEELYNILPHDIKVIEDIIVDDVEDTNDDLSEDTISVLERYIDDMEIDTNKNTLKTILKQLYLESMEIDV